MQRMSRNPGCCICYGYACLKKQLASKEITQQEYAELEYQLKLDYVRKTTEAAIDALELEFETKI